MVDTAYRTLANNMSKMSSAMQKNNKLDGDGVEPTQGENEIVEPFNPSEIDIISVNAVLGQLVERIENSYSLTAAAYVCLDPEFQRADDLWPLDQKSRLIESVLLGIPLPMFYVSAKANGVWDVVDGIQRLGTFRDFMLGKEYLASLASLSPQLEKKGCGFRLEGLEFLTQFNGHNYLDLPGKQQNDLKGCNVQVTVIRPGTPDAVKFNIFKRINTGGAPLTPQEIRHALHLGTATNLLKTLVNLPEFQNATDGSVNDSRMEGRELILRLLSTYILRWERSASAKFNIDNLLTQTMRILNVIGNTPEKGKEALLAYDKSITIASLCEFFKKSMHRNRLLFDEYAFRKSLPGASRRTQINKALFEMWGVLLGELPEDIWTTLLSRKVDFIQGCHDIYSKEGFDNSVGQWATLRDVVRTRYDNVQQLINKYTL